MSEQIPQSYVAIDLETTGLNPKEDKIIEIGGILVRDGVVAKEKATLVNPRKILSEHIKELTGIEDSELEQAPGIEEIIEEYLNFCEDLPLLGHNIMFDYRFLKRAAVNHGFLFEKDGIDTLTLSRKFMPEDLPKNLGSSCSYYHIKTTSAHRALADAYGAHYLYQSMAKLYGKEAAREFFPKKLIYKVKKEQPASKRQKEVLHELIKYHKIETTVQIEYLSRNEVSRMTDKIISQYGRITTR